MRPEHCGFVSTLSSMARREARRSQRTALIALSAVAGGVFHGSPTGIGLLDIAWSAAFAGALATFAARSTPLALLPAGAAAALLSGSGVGLALSAASVLTAALAAVRLSSSSRLAAVAGGFLALALIHPGSASAVASLAGGVGVTTAVVGFGWHGMPRHRRRRVLSVVVPVAAVIAVCAGAGALAGLRASSSVDVGIDAMRAARVAAAGGDLEAAVADFAAAEGAFRAAASTVGTYGRLGRLVPGLSRQLDAANTAVDTAGDAASAMREAGASIDLDELAVEDGRLHLDALRAAEAPLAVAVDSLVHAVRRLDAVGERGLLPPIRDALEDAVHEARAASATVERTHRAAGEVPALLGGAGVTRFLVLFTSPVEARNRFGFPGGYALLRFDDGRISLERAGDIGEIDPPGRSFDEAAIRIPIRAEPFRPYGVARTWRSVTLPSHGPAVAELAIQFADRVGAGPVDGVAIADPWALAEIVDLVGGIAVPEVDLRLDSDTTVPFLVREQYLAYPELGRQDDRKDALSLVAGVVGRALSSLSVSSARDVTERFGALVEGGHLVVSVPSEVRPRAADLLADLGLDGGFPHTDRGLLYVGERNNVGNKIDLFLERELDYELTAREDGTVNGVLRIRLKNGAPAGGLPTYLIGSALRPPPPPGTNLTTVLVYSPYELQSLTVDGSPTAAPALVDGGLLVYQVGLDLAAGQVREVVAELSGAAGPDPLSVEVHRGSLPTADHVRVRIVDERYDRSASFDGEVDAPRCVAVQGARCDGG
jgi:hypothetical protein